MEYKTPKIIHQTWKTSDVPEHLKLYQNSWLEINPTYQYILHTDDDIDLYVLQKAPQFYEAYKKFKTHIERVDFVRYVLLYEMGGIYADLDEVCLKSLDPLIAKNQIVLGYEPMEHNKLYFRDHVLCNAFMISPPHHPFWMDFMNYIIDHYNDVYYAPWKNSAIYRTGPMALTMFYDSIWDRDKYNICLLSSCAFFAMTDNFTDRTVDGYPYITSECTDLSHTFSIHCWSHSWLSPQEKFLVAHKTKLFYVMLLLIAIGIFMFMKSRSKNKSQ